MSEEMPLDVTGQQRLFLSQFLDVVLPENPLPRGVCFPDIFLRVILADGYKADAGR